MFFIPAGDEALDLSHYDFIAMDWRNDPKQQNYVFAESKELVSQDILINCYVC